MKKLILLCILMPVIAFAGFNDFQWSGFTLGGGVCQEQKPVLTVTPTSYAFGNVSSTKTRTTNIALSNTGNAALTGITFGAFSSAVFTHSSSASAPCGTTLAAKASCNRKVSFTPAAVASYTGTLVIDSDQLAVRAVNVTGTGTSVVTGAWYYPGAYGETSFTAPNGWLAGYAAGSKITAGATGNATKIGVNFRVDPGVSCKVALYDTSTPANRLSTGATFTPSIGWNSVNIPSAAVTSGSVYAPLVDCNGAFDIYSVSVAGTGVYGNPTYAAFPTATQTLTVDTLANGVRIWIE